MESMQKRSLAPMPVKVTYVTDEFDGSIECDNERKRTQGFIVLDISPEVAPSKGEWLVPWTEVVFSVKENTDCRETCVASVTAVLLALDKDKFPLEGIPHG
ncbi:hypothetical protein PtrSN002B_012194, partial [Pyrenophora tritici-repentis]